MFTAGHNSENVHLLYVVSKVALNQTPRSELYLFLEHNGRKVTNSLFAAKYSTCHCLCRTSDLSLENNLRNNHWS